MKPISLLIATLFLVSFFQIQAQEWAPIGAEWRYEANATGVSGSNVYTLIRIEKDTIVESQECRKYNVYTQPVGLETNIFKNSGYTFERNDSIFYWHQDTFLLRYDFSANIGDTIIIPTPDFSTSPTDADSFRVVLENISVLEIGTTNVPLEYYNTSFIDGAFSYGGYYRVIGSEYLWGGIRYIGELPIVGSPYNRLRCYKDANHEIFITDLNCSFPSAAYELIDKEKLKLYPNPVRNQVRIQYDPSLSGSKFRLLNQLGQVISIGRLPSSNTEYSLDINHLPQGVWWLEVVNNDKRGMWKIVKI